MVLWAEQVKLRVREKLEYALEQTPLEGRAHSNIHYHKRYFEHNEPTLLTVLLLSVSRTAALRLAEEKRRLAVGIGCLAPLVTAIDVIANNTTIWIAGWSGQVHLGGDPTGICGGGDFPGGWRPRQPLQGRGKEGPVNPKPRGATASMTF